MKSRCWRLVRDQLWMATGRTSIAEVIGDHPEEQPHLVGPEAVAGEPGPVGGFLALLDPLLGRPALVVEADDRAIGLGQGGDDEIRILSFRRGASFDSWRFVERFGTT